MGERVIVLGVDAASPELVRRWMSEGKLPAMRALAEAGLSGTVAGVEGLYVGSTWPTFYTGLHPSGHGIYRIDQFEPGTYAFHRPFDIPGGVGGTPFWRLASDAGRRVAVLDVPLSRLAPELNGIQVVEWGGHDAVFGFRTTPPDLADEILQEVGPYPLPTNCNADRRTREDFESFLSGLEEAIRRKTRLTLDVLERDDWDLLVQVFTETHCAGHQCWHIHDSRHPAHDPHLLEGLGDPLERVYRAADAAVATILERVERTGGGTVLVFSAHGMSYHRGASFLLPAILRRLGVTVPRAVGGHRSRSFRGRALDIARRVWGMLPEGGREMLRPLREEIGPPKGAGGASLGVDVERSHCFPVPTGFPVGGIRLNLAGREPRGVLEPGAEADAFCTRLTGDLLAIVDEESGEPLVARVLRTDDLYPGARRDALPDLLVVWNGERPTGTTAHGEGQGATVRASSPAIGTLEGANDWVRTGEHVPTGFFALAGPGIPRGQREAAVPLVDFHPTLCRLLGLPDPAVDGRVLAELEALGG